MEELKQLRSYASGVHLRAKEDGSESRTIRGYAIVFNRDSEVLGNYGGYPMVERIAPQAVSMELLNREDIVMTLFHDDDLILARSKRGEGTLTYGIDDNGVWFEFEAPNTADGDKAVELVKRGDIDGCSFAFSCAYYPDKDITIEVIEDRAIVTVVTIRHIYDFTLTPHPAYPDTEVAKRRSPLPSPPPQGEGDLSLSEPSLQGEGEISSDNSNTSPLPVPPPQEEGDDINKNPNNSNQSPDNTPSPCGGGLGRGLNNTPMEEKETKNLGLATQIRSIVESGKPGTITLQRETVAQAAETRETTVVNDLAGTGLVPQSVQSILDPINAGLIYDKVGMTIFHNAVGEYIWPTWAGAEVAFVGETEAVLPKKISFDKIKCTPNRMSGSISVSRRSLYQSDGVVEQTALKSIAAAVSRAVNNMLLSPTAVAGAPCSGPFVSAQTKTAALNYKNLVGMRASVWGDVADGGKLAYGLNPADYFDLMTTSRDTGSGLMIIEDGKIAGVPVFTTDAVPAGTAVLGDWSSQAAGFFGPFDITIDPVTKAKSGEVEFTVNVEFGTATLRPKAFAVLKKA